MDEKTAELRDIFIDATGSDTVTERQEESPGSIASNDDEQTTAHLFDLVETMRDRYDFRSSLDTDDLQRVARGFFDGETDATLADVFGVDEEEAFAARMDLHLVGEADHDLDVDLETVRSLVVDDATVDDCIAAVGGDRETVRRAYRVATAETTSTRANHRFRDEFAELLTDDDISTHFAEDARNDGLKDATEDLETDVSL